MDKEEIVTLLEELSDTLSEIGTSIAEGDLDGLDKTLKQVQSDLDQVKEYVSENITEEEKTDD